MPHRALVQIREFDIAQSHADRLHDGGYELGEIIAVWQNGEKDEGETKGEENDGGDDSDKRAENLQEHGNEGSTERREVSQPHKRGRER